MNQNEFIEIELLSDTAFSRGDGSAGIVDVEVEHDELGMPFLGGKTLRGLLHDSWLSMEHCFSELSLSAKRIFGTEADFDERSILRIGDAVMDSETRSWIKAAEYRSNHPIHPKAVLEALTDIRQQTSEERSTGAPAETTLRSVRVIIRGLRLQSPLYWLDDPTHEDLRCLSLALLATRHAGLGRNRGRGHCRMTLDGKIKETLQIAKGGVL